MLLLAVASEVLDYIRTHSDLPSLRALAGVEVQLYYIIKLHTYLQTPGVEDLAHGKRNASTKDPKRQLSVENKQPEQRPDWWRGAF